MLGGNFVGGVFTLIMICSVTAEYNVGVGIADVTGPVAGITLMGYGNMEQQGSGIHLRQWARSFVIEKNGARVVFVNVDCAMMSDGVRIKVVEDLSSTFNGLYNYDNVIISATHTHSGVGGYLMHTLFDLPSFGFSTEAFHAMVSGIVKSVTMAHNKMQKGEIFIKKGRVENANFNRSPTSYQANPEEERMGYPDNVDKDLTQLQFFSKKGEPIGAINWFAVHATSMNNTNTLVSSDNVGYASILFEKKVNGDKLLGKGPFVAAFASSNLGDVSPNVLGPLCHPSGKACHPDSSCSSLFDACFALGPGEDMFASTRIIAERIFDVAWDLWENGRGVPVNGKVGAVHQYVDMPTASVEITDPVTNHTLTGRGCLPAMGYSFAAGTIDGPFATNIVQQGRNSTMTLVNGIRNVFLAKPSQEDINCHAPKPILLFTGGMTFPFDWQPRMVSTQVAQIGNLFLACVPGEFTTMSGRRVRKTVENAAGPGSMAILLGLCNTYSDYITTFEEYQVQRYEGASTLYGPHTLSIHLNQFKKLTQALIQGKSLERGPEPAGMREPKIGLVPPVLLDWPGYGRWFGDVLEEPVPVAAPGDVVRSSFVSGHPRNGLKLDDTYCTVELETSAGIWKVVSTDADWETRFHWRRSWTVLGTSVAVIEYFVPNDAIEGTYRIRHFGHFKNIDGKISTYSGTSRSFTVHQPNNRACSSRIW